MDEKLHILRHLYAEEQDAEHDGAWLRQRIRKDEALRQEYEALADVKRHLDRRPRQRPDVHVVDKVVAAAQKPVARHDRAPARPARHRFPALVGTALTLLMLVSFGLWQLLAPASEREAISAQGETATMDSFASEEVSEAEASPPQLAQSQARSQQSKARTSVTEATPPSAERLAEDRRQPAEPLVASAVPSTERAARSSVGQSAMQTLADVQPIQPAPLVATTADIEWDDADDVRRLYRHIELVQARSDGLEWENPMVPVSAPLLSDPMMTDPRLSEPLLHRPPLEPQLFQTSPPATLGRGQ